MTPRRWMLVTTGLLLATGCGRTGDVAETSPSPEPAQAVVYQPVTLDIDQLSAPGSARVGQPVTVTLRVVLPDGCHEFSRVEVSREGRAVVFTAHGREAQGVFCTQALEYRDTTARFTPSEAGTYQLRPARGTASPVSLEVSP